MASSDFDSPRASARATRTLRPCSEPVSVWSAISDDASLPFPPPAGLAENDIPPGFPEHAAFPSMVQAGSGDLLVVFRMGTAHARWHDGRLVMSRSVDRGRSWTTPRTIMHLQPSAHEEPLVAVQSG